MGKVIVETYYPGQIRSDVQAESTICRNCGHILVWQKIAIPPRWEHQRGVNWHLHPRSHWICECGCKELSRADSWDRFLETGKKDPGSVEVTTFKLKGSGCSCEVKVIEKRLFGAKRCEEFQHQPHLE